MAKRGMHTFRIAKDDSDHRPDSPRGKRLSGSGRLALGKAVAARQLQKTQCSGRFAARLTIEDYSILVNRTWRPALAGDLDLHAVAARYLDSLNQ